MSATNEAPITTRPFLETLRELRNGATLDDLSEQMAALVAAVRDSNKSGSLNLKISIKPATRNDATTVLIEDDVIVKMPKAERAATIMFTTDENGLSRDNPRQKKLDLRGVPDEKPEVLKKVTA